MTDVLNPTYFGSNFNVAGPNSQAIISTLNTLAQKSPLFAAAIRAIGDTPVNFTDANLNQNSKGGSVTFGDTVDKTNLIGDVSSYNIRIDTSAISTTTNTLAVSTSTNSIVTVPASLADTIAHEIGHVLYGAIVDGSATGGHILGYTDDVIYFANAVGLQIGGSYFQPVSNFTAIVSNNILGGGSFGGISQSTIDFLNPTSQGHPFSPVLLSDGTPKINPDGTPAIVLPSAPSNVLMGGTGVFNSGGFLGIFKDSVTVDVSGNSGPLPFTVDGITAPLALDSSGNVLATFSIGSGTATVALNPTTSAVVNDPTAVTAPLANGQTVTLLGLGGSSPFALISNDNSVTAGAVSSNVLAYPRWSGAASMTPQPLSRRGGPSRISPVGGNRMARRWSSDRLCGFDVREGRAGGGARLRTVSWNRSSGGRAGHLAGAAVSVEHGRGLMEPSGRSESAAIFVAGHTRRLLVFSEPAKLSSKECRSAHRCRHDVSILVGGLG